MNFIWSYVNIKLYIFNPCFRFANSNTLNVRNRLEWTGDEDSIYLNERSEQELQNLLETYLKEHDKKGQSIYHRTVAEKLFSIKLHVPTWLRNSYKSRNWSELIALHIKYNLVEEATDLVIELIDHVLTEARQCTNVKVFKC